MKIEHKGDIRLSNDDKSVISVSLSGYLKIYKKTFGNKRGIEIVNVNGKLSYSYYSGNKKLPFEPEGSNWLAEILLEVIRKTGIDAERRAARIYKKGGITAVLEEVAEIPYDSEKNKTLGNLKISKFSNSQKASYLKVVKSMSYDSEKAKALILYDADYHDNKNLSILYFTILKGMSYDSYRGKALNNLLVG
ncbi:MAG: hypothetical protein B6I20_12125 [Bacteroidetes bacterium 4572_117]|nr:MAG: hypothetical protein B6I20_12125 [Bacteroidetes bacterium 4572_117]